MMGSKEAVQVIRPAQLFYLYNKIILQKKLMPAMKLSKLYAFRIFHFAKLYVLLLLASN